MFDLLPRFRGRAVVWIVFCCLACTLVYWRGLSLPLISDDYIQIWLGRKYLAFSSWPELAGDALYRCRATSIWLTGATELIFGSSQYVFNVSSLIVHILNVALIAALGRFAPIGYRISLLAALLWGLNERHHEAVMWYAALPEQLVFTFVLTTVLFWLAWWQEERRWLYIAALFSFVLALLSKESAVVVCALLAIPLIYQPKRWRLALVAALPFLALAAGYFALNVAAQDTHLHWNDGTFKIGWHFIPVIVNSSARLFTVWGFAALAVLFFFRKSVDWRLPVIALLWVPITLAPYAFVAYQPRVPSRHLYLASVGLALLIATALQFFQNRHRVMAAFIAVYLVFNTSYVWFYKQQQFLDRANVTEDLIHETRALVDQSGVHPIQVSCFPLAPEIASIALSQNLHVSASLVFVQAATDSSCGKARVSLVLD